MSISAPTVWEINAAATAGNVNGAGFDPSAATATDLACDTGTGNTASPVVSSASYNFEAGDVGKHLYNGGGTGWTPGWYPIVSVALNKATLNAAIGAAIQTDATKGYPTPKYVANTVAGCATVGTPIGGTWAIDYSQHTAAISTAADLVVDGTLNTKVTSATRVFGVNDVGNHLHQTTSTGGWTAGWYRIVSVAAGAATLDRSPAATGVTGGTWYEGGAMSLGSATLDDPFFENGVGGNRFFVKAGTTVTFGQTVSIAAAGSAQLPVVIEGYQTLRGDAPTGANRPQITAATTWTLGANWDVYNLRCLMTTGSNGVSLGTTGKMVNCKIVNTSTTAGQRALTIAVAAFVWNTELISYRGNGVVATGGHLWNVYAHDSDVALQLGACSAVGCIAESCVTAAIVATSNQAYLFNCTLYGAENKTGVGISAAAGQSNQRILNTIIYGFVTGINYADASKTEHFSDYNDFFNNTTNRTNVPIGPNDQALDPQFAGVSQITGTAAKFAASNDRLIDSSKNFTALGVIPGRDCVYIKSGTSVTAGIYGIASIATTSSTGDTLVLDLAPGTSTATDHAYQITIGHNFAIGANLKARGFPGAFPAGLSTGYTDIGAVQRAEPATLGAGPFGMIR